MPLRTTVPPERAWFVTDKGHRDARDAPTCACRPKIVGLLVECPECGTVFGHLRESLNNMTGRAEYKH